MLRIGRGMNADKSASSLDEPGERGFLVGIENVSGGAEEDDYRILVQVLIGKQLGVFAVRHSEVVLQRQLLDRIHALRDRRMPKPGGLGEKQNLKSLILRRLSEGEHENYEKLQEEELQESCRTGCAAACFQFSVMESACRFNASGHPSLSRVPAGCQV
jgi:hypothetical protein